MIYQTYFDLFRYILNWLTNPVCRNFLLLGLAFGVWYRFYRWFS